MNKMNDINFKSMQTNMCDDDLIIAIRKYGVRYVIRNFKLTPEIMKRITCGEFSVIHDEDDIMENEIIEFQKKFKSA